MHDRTTRPALLATLAVLALTAASPQLTAQQQGPPAPPPTGARATPVPSLGPALPADAAERVLDAERSLAEADSRLIAGGGTHDSRLAALRDAIDAASSIVETRVLHQGNEPIVRWRDPSGAPALWHELRTARARLDDLNELRTLDEAGLEAWALTRRQHDEAISAARAGRFVDARNILNALFAERTARPDLSPQRLDTLARLRDLALIEQNLGETPAAVERLSTLVDDYRARLGDRHPVTLDTLNTYALALNAVGRQDDAASRFDEVLAGRTHVLGASHPATLVALLNTGFADLNASRTDRALERFDDAYGGLRDTLGEADPTTLVAAESRGVALQRLRRLDEALEMYLGVESGRRATLGPEHPDTLRAASNVATALGMQDRLAEAAFRANIVVEGRRRQLGEGHPLYLASAGDLADLLLRQGRYERAASFATRAHDGWRTTLGDAHPESLDALDRLARTRLAQGRAEEALGMLSGALRLRTGAGLAETPAALASAHTLAHARFMTGREDEAIDGLRTLLDRLAGADDAGVRRSLAIALLRTGDREAAAEHASALASGDAPVSDRALAAIASGADVETLDALAQASKAELGPHAPTTVALTHALARALHATDPDRAADLYARALERTLAARPARTLDVFVPAAMEIAVDYAHLLLEQGRTAEAFDTIQRLRSFEAFDLFVRTASDRSILRTQLTPEQRATYEDLLGREADARATVYEAELRADELRALEGDPLGDARVAHADATRALVRFVLDACDTITPMGSAAIAQRLAPGRAYADIAATRERLLLFWVTADGVEGRVMSDDPQRIERLARAATRVRTQCIDPEGDDPRDSGALVTLRNGLLPAELRRLLNDGIGSCALTISAPFDYTPMSLLAPNAAIARTPTASGVFTSSTDDTPTRTLALTADTPDTPDADARLVDALASLTADPFSRYDAASGSADAMRARIAEVAPTRLHAAIPVWLDAQVSSGFLPDYAAAPSVFDLVDTLGLRTNALRLVALPDARPHTPIVRTPRPDTIAPTLVGAGVRNALYLLWEQDPDASALLVARFYANTDGRTGAGAMPAGEALLEAQRWLRTLTRDRIADAEDLATLATSPIDSDASGDRAYTHPRYWSGFVLAGAPWGEGVAGE